MTSELCLLVLSMDDDSCVHVEVLNNQGSLLYLEAGDFNATYNQLFWPLVLSKSQSSSAQICVSTCWKLIVGSQLDLGSFCCMKWWMQPIFCKGSMKENCQFIFPQFSKPRAPSVLTRRMSFIESSKKIKIPSPRPHTNMNELEDVGKQKEGERERERDRCPAPMSLTDREHLSEHLLINRAAFPDTQKSLSRNLKSAYKLVIVVHNGINYCFIPWNVGQVFFRRQVDMLDLINKKSLKLIISNHKLISSVFIVLQ